ncbi:MAG TPA: hypothetical protein VF988_13105 [Verrucomicrobiae bacterium]
MDDPQRGALTLVRLVGVLLLIWAALELGLYWAVCANPSHPQAMHVMPVILKLIPAFCGCLVLIKARAIAEWISNTLDL